MEKMTGKVWVLGDDIDTDIIIPTEYLALKTIDDMSTDSIRSARSLQDRSSRAISLLPERTSAAALPGNRPRRSSKRWESNA